ncbi:hypothetical protein FB451DRAFT_1369282 [Mycena latifolia]|nr:hypothetical protein FB451DRAFT_1369282 [Mycena latifolia]
MPMVVSCSSATDKHSEALVKQQGQRPSNRNLTFIQKFDLPVYLSLTTPPESPHDYPLYPTTNVPYAPPRGAYPGQYMMVPQAPPTFSYAPQPPSIHTGYPTLIPYPFAPYTQDPPSPVQPRPSYAPSFGYPSPISPSHPAYPQPPAPYSPCYPQQHQLGGTWWYMPAQHPHSQPYLHPPYGPGYPFLESPSARGYPASSYAHASMPSASSTPPPLPSPANLWYDKPLVSRAYHPAPPAHRSEWVMWAGNVPSDATYDELWRFFTAPPDSASTSASTSAPHHDAVQAQAARGSGVISIFPISRSSCAFVNYETKAHVKLRSFS